MGLEAATLGSTGLTPFSNHFNTGLISRSSICFFLKSHIEYGNAHDFSLEDSCSLPGVPGLLGDACVSASVPGTPTTSLVGSFFPVLPLQHPVLSYFVLFLPLAAVTVATISESYACGPLVWE